MDDEALARRMQMEELQALNADFSIDEDFRLAMELQEAEYIAEQMREFSMRRGPTTPNHKYEKVTVSSYYNAIYEEAWHDEEERYDDDEYLQMKLGGEAAKVLPTKNHHNASKTSGRQPSGKFKHASVKKANSPQRVNSNNGKTPSPTKSTLVQSPPPQSPKHDIQDTVREEDETQEVSEADEPESESDLTVSEKAGDDTPTKGSKKGSAKKLKKLHKQEVLLPTSEGVLDGHTRMKLYKLINEGKIDNLSGVIQTGKEASVYHARSGDVEYAIKIYKTTLAEFKDREKYLIGEWRFRNQTSKGMTTRKLIKLWAEKELRNLKRLQSCGLNAPRPVFHKGHIIVMDFIGSDGWPAPTLAKAKIDDPSQWQRLYIDVVHLLRDLYQKANLVHADLSEWNLLLHNDKLIVIDLAQAVDYEHPNALSFLRRDCENMTKFFMKKGVKDTLRLRQLFELVADKYIEDVDNRIAALQEQNRQNPERSAADEVEEAVFLKSFIPRTLSDVVDPIEELESLRSGGVESILHAHVTGLAQCGTSMTVGSEHTDSGSV